MGPIEQAAQMLPSGRRERVEQVAILLAGLSPMERRIALNEIAGAVPTEPDPDPGYDVDRVNNTKAFLREQTAYDSAYGGESFVVTLHNLERAMRYQPWSQGQVEQGDRVREALTSTSRVFLRELPDNPLRRRLLEEVLQLRMLANMAISFPRGF
jgi:hypothetical protein